MVAPKAGGDQALRPDHLADLRASGLCDDQIRACGFYTESDPAAVAKLLNWSEPATKLGPCLCIPFFNPNGTPMGYVRVKPSEPRSLKTGKPAKYESAKGASNRAYFPPATRARIADPSTVILVTEGEKKAAADQHGFACIGLVGVEGWSKKRGTAPDGRKVGPRELIPDLAAINWSGRKVIIAYDSDAVTKPAVQWAQCNFGEALQAAGADVSAVRLPAGPDGAKVGLDDYLLTHTADELRERLNSAAPPTRPARTDARPSIVIGTDEWRVNGEAVAAIATEPDLYQRGGMLVQVVSTEPDADANAAVRRPPGSLVVREIPPALLRERLTRCALWLKLGGGEDEEYKPVHPPAWSVNAVHARGAWPSVRHLEAVVNHPVVLGNGSILTANGYDAPSRLLVCIPSDLRHDIPDRPAQRDAAAAVATINDALQDFPFESPAHRAAWFAGLLTPLAWFGFDGPAPLLLIDANTRGAGKGLLADVIALVLTGRRFPVMSYTSDKEELRKKITSLAIEGERLVLLDNLAGAVGNDVLDMALTADRWKDRVLGGNKVFDGPLNVTWVATGNNVQLAADTARRCSHCRLETVHERPELRADVRYPNLRAHVREQRGRLLSAALTILKSWYAAGRPKHNLPPWGSFEGWSGVVRDAVVFAGLPDPGETRLALQTSSDRDALAMGAILSCLEHMDPHRRGVTTAEVIERVKDVNDSPPTWVGDLRSAVEELCGKLDGRALGGRFRHFQRRNFGGRMLCKGGADRTNSNRWEVVPVGTSSARAESAPASPASPASPADAGAGDAGVEGAVPAPAESRRGRSDTGTTTGHTTRGGRHDSDAEHRTRDARLRSAIWPRGRRERPHLRHRAAGTGRCVTSAAHGRSRRADGPALVGEYGREGAGGRTEPGGADSGRNRSAHGRRG